MVFLRLEPKTDLSERVRRSARRAGPGKLLRILSHVVVAVAVLFTVSTEAQVAAGTDDIERGKSTLELGVVAGFPSLVGVELGWWNAFGAPLLLRLHLGGTYFAVTDRVGTVQTGWFCAAADAGYLIDRDGSFKQWIGLSGGVGIGSDFGFAFVGPSWGFHYSKAFSVTVGPTVLVTERTTLFPLPFAKIGASWFF
jgi:hypothetical protein